MKTIAILVSGGLVQGVFEVEGSPHQRVIIIDDDNIREAEGETRQLEALSQLEGYEPDGTVKYNEIHSELSNYISSDDVYEPLED